MAAKKHTDMFQENIAVCLPRTYYYVLAEHTSMFPRNYPNGFPETIQIVFQAG
jgi:hypothetical protein